MGVCGGQLARIHAWTVSSGRHSAYLGHHDPGFPLRTYTYLMPSSGTRTRAAVDRVFADEEPRMGGPDTAQEGA